MQSINEISKKEFISLFKNVFEKSEWIADDLYNSRPFSNFNDLENKIIKIFDKLSDEKKLIVLINHPDLANKSKISTLTKESGNEQIGSKLDQCSEDEYNEFKNLNIQYKNKFGFPFILAVSGKDKNEILLNFKKRLLLNKDNEFKEAIIQVKKIANLRLQQINNNIVN